MFVYLTAMTLTKSFSPSVSRMVLMVCLAMVIFRPFMLPLMSTMMMMSFGDVAAWMYLHTGRQETLKSYHSTIFIYTLANFALTERGFQGKSLPHAVPHRPSGKSRPLHTRKALLMTHFIRGRGAVRGVNFTSTHTHPSN